MLKDILQEDLEMKENSKIKENLNEKNQQGEQEMSEQNKSEKEMEKNEDASIEAQLPENVTLEPRNEEEMHLKHIRQWPDAVKVYLKVSDDAGEVLGSKILERQVKLFCEQHADPKAEVKDVAKALESAKDLATRYTLQINMVESGLTGTITKYRIRQGELFLIMKNLVKGIEGARWIEWFKVNFDGREFRSVQDYMRLAKVPGIIRYAVFGKERLLEILRQLTPADKKTDDHVGTFIERNGIDFNPAEEVDAQELRIQTDIAINHQKLRDECISDITKEMVEVLVRNGREVESSHIRELKAAKEIGNDVVDKFQEILASDGKLEPLMTPDRKATVFKKATDRFIQVMESAIKDRDYRRDVNEDLITKLTETLGQLITEAFPNT